VTLDVVALSLPLITRVPKGYLATQGTLDEIERVMIFGRLPALLLRASL
jgi:hypothetical protein